MNRTFLIAGGDLRFAALAEKLAEENTVYTAGFDGNSFSSDKARHLKRITEMKERADCLVLPLPASPDGVTVVTPYSGKSIFLENLVPAVKEGGIIFGGMITPEVRRAFDGASVYFEDYAAREEFAVLNAVATAEGAVQVAMEELPTTLSGRKILILGAGRIAKVLIETLRGFHTDITVAARKCADLAWADVYGCDGVHIGYIDDVLGDIDVIFNTVPAIILDEKLLKKVGKDCLVIDLASKPGGVDLDTAGMLGVKTIWLLSLPGKVAPVTSGEVIAETIENILSERAEGGEQYVRD